ncbi:MAG: 2-aminobenzoate-CoA ligase [Rhodospirillaceae bacterium]|nr:2-aminobenzoate-CoA ligase [Rhodospirillaceae bacterium]|tara:strand:- start:4823 stop:6484 length:1662 start_codon:yes stop_codon:yes gene_type:complete
MSTAHQDTFIIDNMPPEEMWPDMDYSVLPELAAYPERMNVATELLDNMVASGCADKPMIYFGEEIWTYTDLLERSNQIANVLVEDYGMVPGERVLLRSGNHPMLIASWFAVIKVGGIAIATMPVLRERELVYMLGKARVNLAISDIKLSDDIAAAGKKSDDLRDILYFGDESAKSLDKLMGQKSTEFENVDTSACDPCVIGFTSGSTGTPKGTLHFHRDILAVADTFIRYVVKIQPDDIVCGSPQIAFLYGLCAYMTDTMRFGASTVIVERATPEVLLQTIEKFKATVCFSTPSGYKLMLDEIDKYDTSSLRLCVAGGEPLAPAVFHGWEEKTGVRIINGLGISELLHIFISASGDDIRPGLIGKAVPGFEVRVVDEEFNDTKPGEIGQMIVKGPNGCRYLDDIDRQKAYIRDGWNLSGDLCIRDEEGYFSYEARTDDMILTGGYNVSGLEVEAVLMEHSAIREVAVVGSPDKDRGQVVKAFIELRDKNAAGDPLIGELQDFVKSQISAFKYPRAIEFVDELPHTPTGKIQRGALRQLERERAEQYLNFLNRL